MKNILWLPAWYPNKAEPYAGDFIQRHARAVSLYLAIQVIHIVRDTDGNVTKKIKEENFQTGNLAETIIYYHSPVFPIAFIDKIIAARYYRRLYRHAIRRYINDKGPPICTHVHVINKNALPALWLHRRYNIPIVVTEHWTVYLPGALPNFKNFSWIFRKLWNKVMKSSKGLSTVSNYLGHAITQIKKDISFTVIPNVVDDTSFFPALRKEDPLTHFIHISTLGYQKNPEAILHAFAIVKKTNPGFSVSFVGPVKNDLQQLAIGLNLEDEVHFYDEMPQAQLAIFIQQAHALILYSRYETFGCVLIEANACAVPVIVSDIPVFHEIIKEGVNGYFVPGENPEALAQKIIWFMENGKQKSFEQVVAITRGKYNYSSVGKLFYAFYEKALKN